MWRPDLERTERSQNMKLKLDDKGVVVVNNGMPVYVDKDGKDIEVDVPSLFTKITTLNAENKQRRERAEALEGTLKIFDGIEDLPKWRSEADEAFKKVKNFSQKDLIEANKVEEIKKEMKAAHEEEKGKLLKSFQEKDATWQGTVKQKDDMIYSLMVSSKFAQSPFFTGEKAKTLLPPEIAETYFGKNFRVEDDGKGKLRVTGYINGNAIYSRKNPGELADFEEALEAIIESYPLKDRIIRAGESGGSGGGGGAGGGGAGGGHPLKVKVEKLQVAYDEALKKKDMKLAITLKNQLHEARKQLVKAGLNA
jgi:hypothetical protein